MAIIKEKEADNLGITGNYWKIECLNNNYDEESVYISIVLWLSKVLRDLKKGKTQERIDFIFNVNDSPVANPKTFTAEDAYGHIKSVIANAETKRTNNESLTPNELKAETLYGYTNLK